MRNADQSDNFTDLAGQETLIVEKTNHGSNDPTIAPPSTVDATEALECIGRNDLDDFDIVEQDDSQLELAVGDLIAGYRVS